MIIKVCGLKDDNQIFQLDQLPAVNWLGSIFYEKSKRYVPSCSKFITSSKKVGVFVNDIMTNIVEKADRNKLDILQLHGSESPEECLNLKQFYTVVKAFGIDEDFDFDQLKKFESAVDYFLFDTKTIHHGGSGKRFNWDLLKQYNLSVPFLLSGGINPNSVQDLLNFKHPSFAGIDLNSGFENAPADKNIEKIKNFIEDLTTVTAQNI
jgi:phosphoribosylanthranilate isomerase